MTSKRVRETRTQSASQRLVSLWLKCRMELCDGIRDLTSLRGRDYLIFMTFQEVNPQISFSDEEEKILKFWQDQNTFQKSISNHSTSKPYTFYDGPPFATGLPHYGHLLAGIIKDIIPRYWTMKGFHIERRFGWDCHGLPIEYEIDKTLGISGKAGVEEFGIAKYNAECRNIVLRFTAEWEKTVKRMGRWVDFENDYKTMDASFMESVWWVFKQLWDKGLIYSGHRVMPYSTAVATPLSNFEASSNYREAQDPALTVMFTATDEPDLDYLAWTTTPWTLPSNLALSVGSKIIYVKIFSKKHGRKFILGESRLRFYFPKTEDYDLLETFLGAKLEGKSYTPPFSYFENKKQDGAFKILLGDHVTDTDGTGIVHTAPAFGEDDYQICQKYGITLVIPVDDDGKFTQEVPDFAGQHVKDADKNIIAWLKDKKKLLRHDTITHSVSFCWRSDTPLIFRAVSSWFVNVEKIKKAIIAANQETHWVPENLRDGRFGNWLEGARDWNISRSRYWGNPLPIWLNKETGEKICVGSIAELEKLTGTKITDIHREFLDDLEIPSPTGKGVLRRVPEVLDCWFESGAMPYAQSHYPFENKESFEKAFPADFIAEGLDQTRGWFYTLTVLGAALFGKSPFKNVIVNGMILAEDGKKMSKRLKNYPDPTDVLNTYGADALRLYLINSPAVRAEELRFSETGVKDIVRRVLLKWWNAYSFFISYAVIDRWEPGTLSRSATTLSHKGRGEKDNILDSWILSRLQTLLQITEREMAGYRLYTVVPALLDFIEDLTNTYIRLNRKRFWSEGESADKEAAYHTLYTVLVTLTKIMAPFTPFLAETMYQNLCSGTVCPGADSVHLTDFPLANESLIKMDLEKSVALMNRIILMGRNLREKNNIKVKIPLKKIAIIHRKKDYLAALKILENDIREELNVRAVEYLTNEDDFVELSAKANGAALGKKLGPKFGAIGKAIQNLKSDDIVRLEHGETLTLEGDKIAGEKITKDDVLIYRKAKAGSDNVVSDAFITVNLDLSLDQDQIQEGLAREVVSRIQKLRKESGLNLADRIYLEYQADQDLATAIEKNRNTIMDQTLALELKVVDNPQGSFSETCDVDGMKLVVALRKNI